MRRADVLALAARVEAADERNQGAMLWDVLVALHKAGIITDGVYDAAQKFRKAGAFFDAAASLVPAGWRWEAHSHGEAYVANDEWSIGVEIGAPAPALALTAAALRAIAEGISDD